MRQPFGAAAGLSAACLGLALSSLLLRWQVGARFGRWDATVEGWPVARTFGAVAALLLSAAYGLLARRVGEVEE